MTVENFAGVDFEGVVTCYHQPSDHFARFAGEITHIDGEVSTHFRIAVNQDWDWKGHEDVDLISVQTRRRCEPLACSGESVKVIASQVIREGSLEVHSR